MFPPGFAPASNMVKVFDPIAKEEVYLDATKLGGNPLEVTLEAGLQSPGTPTSRLAPQTASQSTGGAGAEDGSFAFNTGVGPQALNTMQGGP